MTPELTEILKASLLVLLIICAVAASLMKRVVPALIVFTSFSLIMAVVWVLLESPDLAITEAAVGAGVSGVLFYMAIRRMGQFEKERRADGKDAEESAEAPGERENEDENDVAEGESATDDESGGRR